MFHKWILSALVQKVAKQQCLTFLLRWIDISQESNLCGNLIFTYLFPEIPSLWLKCVSWSFLLLLSRTPAISLGCEPFGWSLMTQKMYWSHLISLQAHFKNSLIETSAKISVRGNIHALPMMTLLLQLLLRKWNPGFQISLTLTGLPFSISSCPENHSCQANSA